MFVFTAKFHRKRTVFAVIAFGILLAAVILLKGISASKADDVPLAPLPDNAARLAYISSFGWQVSPEPVEILDLWLSDTLDEEYSDYNALQLSQGFDLRAYCSQNVQRYTYTVLNHPVSDSGVQLNLYCCDDVPIAGDVVVLGEGGFVDTLFYPQT